MRRVPTCFGGVSLCGSFEVDIWDNNNLTLLAQYKALAGDAVGMFSMQPEELPGTNNWLPDGTPVVIAAKYEPSVSIGIMGCRPRCGMGVVTVSGPTHP